jgi:predicted nucleic acid-binding protein
MRVVVDTNIIFSALLKEDNRYARALIKNEDAHDFYAVYFTIVELFKHKERIKQFSKLSEEDILEALYELLKHINIINDHFISVSSWKEAMQLAHDVDVKDVPNVALTIELNAQFWTNDNALKKGLQVKGFNHFIDL